MLHHITPKCSRLLQNNLYIRLLQNIPDYSRMLQITPECADYTDYADCSRMLQNAPDYHGGIATQGSRPKGDAMAQAAPTLGNGPRGGCPKLGQASPRNNPSSHAHGRSPASFGLPALTSSSTPVGELPVAQRSAAGPCEQSCDELWRCLAWSRSGGACRQGLDLCVGLVCVPPSRARPRAPIAHTPSMHSRMVLEWARDHGASMYHP
jgi:hypothetical protein